MFQRKFRFPGSLFPLYYETLIEGTRSVIFLPRESRKTRHFYATQCEVYLGRISILHESKLYVCVYVCVALDIIHSTKTSYVITVGIFNKRRKLLVKLVYNIYM